MKNFLKVNVLIDLIMGSIYTIIIKKDALNLISNSEASKSNKNEFPGKNQNEQLTELFDNLVT